MVEDERSPGGGVEEEEQQQAHRLVGRRRRARRHAESDGPVRVLAAARARRERVAGHGDVPAASASSSRPACSVPSTASWLDAGATDEFERLDAGGGMVGGGMRVAPTSSSGWMRVEAWWPVGEQWDAGAAAGANGIGRR